MDDEGRVLGDIKDAIESTSSWSDVHRWWVEVARHST
jgi:hypothetical protein